MKHVCKGFSLFELTIVIIVIAILSMVAIKKFFKPVSDAQFRVVSFQANTFARSIEHIHALGSVQNARVVDLKNGLYVYMNTHGWPVATASVAKTMRNKASKEGCESLWSDLFRYARERNNNESEFAQEKFEISLINGRFCRYKLTRKQEGLFFFDYDVVTGNIDIASP